ncbi:hypothetical protein [Nostoc sp.]|uniref:hypothetical protein n=1 Tax=Nostoc sp. TaxID=1180 RepID=UPI002FF51FDB
MARYQELLGGKYLLQTDPRGVGVARRRHRTETTEDGGSETGHIGRFGTKIDFY